MKGVSVVVCCYNSTHRLPKTLEYLSKQKVQPSVQWEIIIVDNNSTDNTATLASQLWRNTSVPLVVVNERKIGLSYARNNGLSQARYDYVIFCDDDNWLAENYVDYSYQFLEAHPEVGILGGLGKPFFDYDPPPWFASFKEAYAVGPQRLGSGDVTVSRGYVYGAGMALRKYVWEQLSMFGFQSLLSDRKGNSLASGGDTELCYVFRLMGYKIYYSEEMQFLHYIPLQRLSVSYLYSLHKAFAQSRTILFLYNLETRMLTKRWFWFREIFYFFRSGFLRNLMGYLLQPKLSEKHLYCHNKLYFYWTLLKNRKGFNMACSNITELKKKILNGSN